MFAILRTQKHNSADTIRRRCNHHLRAHDVQNADPALAGLNHAWGPSQAAQLARAIQERVEPLVKRKDNVRCIEVLLTASPEWFGSDRPGQARRLTKAAAQWLSAEFGRDNVMGFGLHMDETTPHVWAMVTPIVAGRLNASALTGSPEKMRQLQDRWAKLTAPLGLVRGVRKSGARHTTIRTFYAAANGCEKARAALEQEQAKRAAKAQQLAAEAQARADAAMAEARRIKARNAATLAVIEQFAMDRKADLVKRAQANPALARPAATNDNVGDLSSSAPKSQQLQTYSGVNAVARRLRGG